MKILWVSGSRIVGGAEHATLRLADLLREQGHAIEALCRPDGELPRFLERAHVAAHPAALGGPVNVRAPGAICRALDAVAPQIALVTTSDEWVWSCLAKRRRHQTKLVLVRHMVLPLSWPVRWLAARRADAVVAVSNAVRTSLLGRAGPASNRVHVIYNPVRFAPRATVPTGSERAQYRAALGLVTGGRWVGFFGGLSAAKGIRDVLSAVQRANDVLGCTHLLICGRPAGGQTIEQLTREYHLEDRIHYLGQIDGVDAALQAVDAVVMATHSSLSEAFSLTLTEAMACGTPVLGYGTGGILEVIGTDGQAGRLARPDDAGDLARVLIELLSNATASHHLATNALTRVRTRFDAARIADQYEALFRSLCA